MDSPTQGPQLASRRRLWRQFDSTGGFPRTRYERECSEKTNASSRVARRTASWFGRNREDVGNLNDGAVTASGDGDSTSNDQAETRSDSTGSAGCGSGGSGGGSETEDGAEANRTTALFGAQDVLPGSRGTSTAQLSNPRDESVTATFAVGGAVDDENGLTEPEATVDDTATQGELSDHLAVRIAITRESGGRSYLVGSTDGYVSLADAAETTRSLELDPNETVSVVVEWRVDAAVGNEIQSDRTTLSVHCAFEPSTTLLAAIA